MALLQDTAAFYRSVFIILITPVIFRAIPWVASRAAPGWATEGARRTAAQIATIVT
jgi:hypothetical protein